MAGCLEITMATIEERVARIVARRQRTGLLVVSRILTEAARRKTEIACSFSVLVHVCTVALEHAMVVHHHLEIKERDLLSHDGVQHLFEATAGPRFRKKNFLVLQPLQNSLTSTKRFDPRSNNHSRAKRLNETLDFGSLCPSMRG